MQSYLIEMRLAWFRDQLTELNYFGHEEDAQREEGLDSPQDRLTLREQRLATRLYIILLYSKLYSFGDFPSFRGNENTENSICRR